MHDAILIMDCDLEFKSKGYNEGITEILSKDIKDVDGGMLVSFKSCEPRYSYAKTNKDNIVIQTAEKKLFPTMPYVAPIFFKSRKFFYAANTLLHEANFQSQNSMFHYFTIIY